MSEPIPLPAHSNPMAERIRELTMRAERAGYVLVRCAAPRYEWKLLDSEYCDDVFTTSQLDEIDDWLSS